MATKQTVLTARERDAQAARAARAALDRARAGIAADRGPRPGRHVGDDELFPHDGTGDES